MCAQGLGYVTFSELCVPSLQWEHLSWRGPARRNSGNAAVRRLSRPDVKLRSVLGPDDRLLFQRNYVTG